MNPPDFTPHGFCISYDPDLMTWTLLGDGLTAAAYFVIPVQLLVAVWRVGRGQRLVLSDQPWVLALFATFILLCGTTHVMHTITLFQPWYWLQASLTVGTGVVSMLTAGALQWLFKPEARAMAHDFRNLAATHNALVEAFQRAADGRMAPDKARAMAARLEPVVVP